MFVFVEILVYSVMPFKHLIKDFNNKNEYEN